MTLEYSSGVRVGIVDFDFISIMTYLESFAGGPKYSIVDDGFPSHDADKVSRNIEQHCILNTFLELYVHSSNTTKNSSNI